MRKILKAIFGICAGFALLFLVAVFTLPVEEVSNEIISPIPEVTQESTPTPACNPEPKPSYHYGKASWYGAEFCNNKPCRTASGEQFDENRFTAACDYNFPLGSRLIVSYKGNSVEVVCNDRGDFSKACDRRMLDLSKKAFETLAPLSRGVIWVRIKEVR